MRANLDLTGGLLLAERVTTALAPTMGRQAGHDAVATACADALARGVPLAEALSARADVAQRLSAVEITELLRPEGYLGSAPTFIDRALARHQGRSRGT